MTFLLDKALKKDTFFVKDLELCQLLLMNEASYPWVILVPKKDNLTEIIDLDAKDQQLLMKEIAAVSKLIKKELSPDKLNIAALGNMVPQLHIHIIARFKNDRAFPQPVWGVGERTFYEKAEMEGMVKLLGNT